MTDRNAPKYAIQNQVTIFVVQALFMPEQYSLAQSVIWAGRSQLCQRQYAAPIKET